MENNSISLSLFSVGKSVELCCNSPHYDAIGIVRGCAESAVPLVCQGSKLRPGREVCPSRAAHRHRFRERLGVRMHGRRLQRKMQGPWYAGKNLEAPELLPIQDVHPCEGSKG